eukprot:Gb_21441 [translate_table: standard]
MPTMDLALALTSRQPFPSSPPSSQQHGNDFKFKSHKFVRGQLFAGVGFIQRQSSKCTSTCVISKFTSLKTEPTLRMNQAIDDPYSTAAKFTTLCKEGRLNEAIDILYAMKGIPSDPEIYGSLLQACTDMKALAPGKQVHAHLLINGHEQNLFLGTKLVSLYAMCGTMDDAHLVFDRLSKRNVILWNGMIRGYASNEPWEEALALYCQMQQSGIQPDKFTYPFVLKACAGLLTLNHGKEIHNHIIRSGYDSDVFVGNALIDMYAKCRSIQNARQVFDKTSKRDIVSWNAIISGYAQNDHANDALELYGQMQLAGVKPNSITVVSVLPACAHLAALEQGKQIHDYVNRNGLLSNVSVGNALVDMYGKCESIEDARHVFDKMSKRDVVSWNAMITGYVQSGHSNEALRIFTQMQLAGVKPNAVTIPSILPACARLEALGHGKELHGYIVKCGFDSDVFVGSALIDMYAKCKSVDIACLVFDKILQRNVVSWNAMIAGYSQNGYANETLTLFRQMQLAGVKPNRVTIVSVLPGCADLAALQQGKEIHGYIIRSGIESDVFAGNALVDMYAKCGSIQIASQVFDQMAEQDVVSWNTMIAGYGIHGYGKESLAHFHNMQQAGLKPDYITFIAVLSACSHAGLVDEGWQYFHRMSQDYHITPTVEHYASMVDLLGRAGQLDEAYNFIKRMPIEPDAGVWGGLLGACRLHNNLKLGERVSEHVLELDPEDVGFYVLLSNIYAAAGRWDDVRKVRKMVKDRGLVKKPGCSWIEVKNKVYTFLVGDRSHPQSDKIYAMLESLSEQIKEAGYVPDTNFVLRDVEEEDKEYMLCGHSERLAIAFGLINTSPGTPIRITKNLRVCGDCHNVTKFISRIVEREFIVRDAIRFHHFKGGLCSCGDYW